MERRVVSGVVDMVVVYSFWSCVIWSKCSGSLMSKCKGGIRFYSLESCLHWTGIAADSGTSGFRTTCLACAYDSPDLNS